MWRGQDLTARGKRLKGKRLKAEVGRQSRLDNQKDRSQRSLAARGSGLRFSITIGMDYEGQLRVQRC
jgi:hypothetical protein